MTEENINQDFRLIIIDKTRNYFLKITTTGCILISTFTTLLGIPLGITSSVIGSKV